MSKIICERVEFKNFFSYGNQWTTLDLTEGVHAIIGNVLEKDRSNSAGKSSLLSSIEFALFGQTSKGVSLNKIVNWKNGKNCEVRFYFKKDGISYIIHRGIKPGILSLSKDGVDQPLLSDKRFFQKEIEQDLIGMDFGFAQMMTFQNTNNMISIFNAKKEEKRRFIEKFFNLEIYTKMNELVNSKLNNISGKLLEIVNNISYKESRIAELEQEIKNTTTINLLDYEEKLKELKSRIDQVDISLINGELSKISLELKGLQGVRTEIETILNRRKVKYDKLKQEITKLETNVISHKKRIETIGDLTEQKSLYERVQAALTKMNGLDDELKQYQDQEQVFTDQINPILLEMKSILSDIKKLENNIDKWNNTRGVEGVECPTCFQQVDPDHIKDHITQKVNELDKEMRSLRTEYDTISSNCEELINTKKSVTDKIKELRDKLDKRVQLEKKLIILSTINEKEKELQQLITELDDFQFNLTLLNTRKSALESEFKDEEDQIREYQVKERELNIESTRLCDILQEQNRREFEYETSLKAYNEKKEIVDKIKFEYQVKVASKSQLEKEVTELKYGIKKSTTLKDYLTYVKETLKDDNTKQYAISSIVPYLNQRTNHYLAETGHNYYIELDNWLDGTIKGQGVGECDFHNMSGGEMRTLDLAFKCAMADVARRQGGSYLDLVVLDELLDSSIDSVGVESMMNIIRLKQQEDNLKVFVVSHREEMGEFGFDNIYKINKSNGFSNLEIL